MLEFKRLQPKWVPLLLQFKSKTHNLHQLTLPEKIPVSHLLICLSRVLTSTTPWRGFGVSDPIQEPIPEDAQYYSPSPANPEAPLICTFPNCSEQQPFPTKAAFKYFTTKWVRSQADRTAGNTKTSTSVPMSVITQYASAEVLETMAASNDTSAKSMGQSLSLALSRPVNEVKGASRGNTTLLII